MRIVLSESLDSLSVEKERHGVPLKLIGSICVFSGVWRVK